MFSMRNLQGGSEERLVEEEIKNYFDKIKKKFIVIVGFILIIGLISTITAVVTMKDRSPNDAAMTNKSSNEGKNIRGMFSKCSFYFQRRNGDPHQAVRNCLDGRSDERSD